MTEDRQPSRRAASSRAVTAGVIMIAIAIAVLLRGPLIAWFSGPAEHRHASPTDPSVAYYTCSMHPSVKQPEPGRCPVCGMDLIAVSREQQQQGIVTIDEARRQLIGVRKQAVALAPMRRQLRAPGHVVYDESKLTDVSLKVQGWVTRLSVDRVGQRVTRGQALFTVYSPELYAAQLDFLLAQPTAAANEASQRPGAFAPLAGSARQRLALLGMSDAQVEQLARTKTALESISMPAPAAGVIIEKNVVEGASIEPGMRLYRIADLKSVWLEADVYEADLPLLRPGQPAVVRLEHLPEQPIAGVIDSIYPYLDPATRTARVRVRLQNDRLELLPGMFASVELDTELGARLQVPTSAVIYTGARRLVFIDLGEGRFRPQELAIGSESGGMSEVLSGLRAGDVVATSGVFLLAAEARIAGATSYWNAPGEAEATNAATPPSPAVPPSSPRTKPNAATPPTPPGSAVPPSNPRAKPEAAQPRAPATARQTEPSAARARVPVPAALYHCPMHPEVTSQTPARCPKCGMQLEATPPGSEPQ